MSVVANITDTASSKAASSSSSVSSTGTNSSSDLQGSFLTLLVAQLKNQDPTNPLQNNELTSQLAQISTLSGIEKLNTTLGSISGQINSGQSLQAGALVGRGVMVPGSTILAGKNSSSESVDTTPFGIELTQAAEKVTATITDGNGNHPQFILDNFGKLIRKIDLDGHIQA